MSSTAEPKVPTTNVVQIDGLVLLKIIKHCTENTSELVMGQLLGMDVDNTLEISHAFPFPTDGDDEREDNAYQIEMLRALRSQNEDANFVGLYHAAFLSETLYSMDLIQAQYAYQLDVPNSVCIMFDPFKSQKGRLSIKAIRLTQNFMQLYAAGKFVPKAMQKHAIDSKGIFDEIPLRVSNSHLVHGFIYGLRETRRFDCTAARLGLGAAPLLDKMVDLVSGPYGCIDDFVTEQDRYKQQQVLANRQKAELQRRIENNADENARRQNLGLPPVFTDSESKVIEPSRLESVILTTKIDSYCRDIRALATQSYHKQSVLRALVDAGSGAAAPAEEPEAVAEDGAVEADDL